VVEVVVGVITQLLHLPQELLIQAVEAAAVELVFLGYYQTEPLVVLE
jgi:hypothetical protein